MTQATIEFKAKVRNIWNIEGTEIVSRLVTVPHLKSNHLHNMENVRGYVAKSNVVLIKQLEGVHLPAILGNAFKYYRDIDLNAIPAGVEVNTSKFLATVKITIN